MKKLMAMALVATLAFSSSVMVFADEAAETVTETTETTESAEGVVAPVETLAPVVEEVVPVVEEPVVEEVPVVENVAFTGKSTDYINKNGETVGVYPSFENNSALTKKIFELVNDTYQDQLRNEPHIYSSTDYGLFFTYEVEETLTAAKIELNSARFSNKTSKIELSVMATYYVDKTNNKEITADAYAALLETEVPATGEVVEGETAAEVVESVMLPLRAYAEALGYVVAWEDGKVTISKDDATVYLATGETTYVNAAGEEVELEAPENIDGTLYVPEEFFTVILGEEVSEELLAAPAVEEVAEEVTEEVVAEEEVAEEATEEAAAEEEVAVEGEETDAPVADVEIPAVTE